MMWEIAGGIVIGYLIIVSLPLLFMILEASWKLIAIAAVMVFVFALYQVEPRLSLLLLSALIAGWIFFGFMLPKDTR